MKKMAEHLSIKRIWTAVKKAFNSSLFVFFFLSVSNHYILHSLSFDFLMIFIGTYFVLATGLSFILSLKKGDE